MNWEDSYMDKVYIGKIVSTHGIKGEIKIISDFQFKSKVFKIENKLIVDNIEYVIKTYRVHKKFDMVTLKGYDNINDVLFLMKKKVYIDKNNLYLDDNEVLDQDLLDFKILTIDGRCGIISEIFFSSPSNKIIRAVFDKEVLIPFNSPMVKKIDKINKEVIVELIEGI